MQLFESREVALFPHLALEDHLLNDAEGSLPVLMIWRGPKAVVLGKNQNPWKECNLEVIQERGLLLGRRVSGGGTVYHDPGNVNFSWIVDRKTYRPERLHALLRKAVARFGLAAETASTGALMVEGYKVSGAAYCYRQDRVLHHGTLLWDADLPMLRAALSAPRVRLKTHAVASIPARVKNLAVLLPNHSVEDLVRAVVAEAEREFGARVLLNVDWPRVEEIALRLRSPEWIWGQTPRFEIGLDVEGVRMEMVIRKGQVASVRVGGAERALSENPRFGLGVSECLAEVSGIGSEVIFAALQDEGWTWWG